MASLTPGAADVRIAGVAQGLDLVSTPGTAPTCGPLASPGGSNLVTAARDRRRARDYDRGRTATTGIARRGSTR